VQYILDTNIFIGAMKGSPPLRARLARVPAEALVLSPIVLGELELGVAKSAARKRNAARLAELVREMELVPLDADVARHYAEIRAHLERCGTPIGANDYWIAAQGRALGAVVVTDNEAEFNRVPGLEVENWSRR
jgi:tRNA(fMet)-specific endonuclease VapC